MDKMKITFIFLLNCLIIIGTTCFAATGIVNAPNGLVLRKEAAKGADPITTVSDKANVEILEQNGEWYKVKYNGNEGYLFAEYVNKEEEKTEKEETKTESEEVEKQEQSAEEAEEQTTSEEGINENTNTYPKKQNVKQDTKIYAKIAPINPPPALDNAVLLLNDIIRLSNVSVMIFVPSPPFISMYFI